MASRNAQREEAEGVTAPAIHIEAYLKCLPCSDFSVLDPYAWSFRGIQPRSWPRASQNLCTPLVAGAFYHDHSATLHLPEETLNTPSEPRVSTRRSTWKCRGTGSGDVMWIGGASFCNRHGGVRRHSVAALSGGTH